MLLCNVVLPSLINPCVQLDFQYSLQQENNQVQHKDYICGNVDFKTLKYVHNCAKTRGKKFNFKCVIEWLHDYLQVQEKITSKTKIKHF